MDEVEEQKPTSQLPATILDQWRDALANTGMDEVIERLLWAGIRYALPPMNSPALSRAIDLYQVDHDIKVEMEYRSAIESLPISRQEVTTVAGSHPLYYAMTNPKKGCYQRDDAFHQAARRLLSEYFSQVDPGDGEDVDADILRSDTQQCRDILRALADDETPAPPEGCRLDRYMLEQIQLRFAGRGNLSDKVERDSQGFTRLFNGIHHLSSGDATSRRPGIRTKQYRARSGGSRPTKRQHDPGFTAELLDAIQRRRPTMPIAWRPIEEARREDQLASQDGHSPGGITLKAYRRTGASKNASGEALDEGEEPGVQRRHASVLTPEDDRLIVARAQRHAAVDTLRSLTDIQRLTPTQISEALETCYEDSPAWALAMLLLSTGMPHARLLALSAVQGPPAEPDALDWETPRWHPSDGWLSYPLLDGPSGAPFDAHRWVVLDLPAPLHHALQHGLEGNSTDGQPLAGIEKRIKKRWRQAFGGSPGQRPSLTRLTASSWPLIRPAATDDVAAQALRGEFGATLAAPAAYRQLRPGELSELFQRVTSRLMTDQSPTSVAVGHIPSSATAWQHPKGRSAMQGCLAETWRTGSSRARPITDFTAWVRCLRDASIDAFDAFLRPLLPRDRSPAALIQAVNLAASHSYLAMLLGTGCRPHAQRVRCELSADQLWISDKNTGRGRDSRVIPLCQPLQAALKGHRDLLMASIMWLSERGITPDDRRTVGQYAQPGMLVMASPRSRRVRIMPITHQAWLAQLSDLPRLTTSQRQEIGEAPANVTRHSVATHLRQTVAGPHLDALLGHSVIGFRQTAPGSSSGAPPRAAIRQAMHGVLTLAGYSPLPYQRWLNALRQ